MAFSVDDLVASLSNNHIGQEAIDLAALHAQLAQAVVAQQSGFTRPTKPIKPCTTPTSATVTCSWNHVSPMAMDDMEYQDERMVEELLIPTQVQVNPEASFPTCTSDHGPAIDPYGPSSPSLFTSTDPFYIAQLRETQTLFRGSAWCDGQMHAGAQTYAHATGDALGGLGRPDETSPFLRVAQTQAQAQAQAQHQQQAQQYHQQLYQRTGDAGAVGDPYTTALYQLEHMYHHHYYPATTVET